MRKILILTIVIFWGSFVFAQTYTFNGNGYWTETANWSNNTVPPSVLPAGDTININPGAGDSCILNTNQVISAGASFNILPNAIFIVNGGVTITGGLPTVTTDTFYTVTNTYATAKGTIIANGSHIITSKGFVWDTIPGPAINRSNIIPEPDTANPFYGRLNGIQPGITYYIKAFATNSQGTGYGIERSITAPLPPVVYTDTVSSITGFSANSGGIIDGAFISSSGLVWDTLPDPTIALSSKTANSVISDTFSNVINGLQPGKTYYVKAYATNSAGTGYGNQRSFVTPWVNANGDSVFRDTRDGQYYTFKHIGTQVWMTKNLNYTGAGRCYANNAAYCAVYGRLYNWNTALTVAPPGWHLPSDAEWQTLVDHLGGDAVAGGKMKEAGTVHWNSPNTGADNSSGFTGIPGGKNTTPSGGTFASLGLEGYWWSSVGSGFWANCFSLSYFYQHVSKGGGYMTSELSVRCIRDTISPPVLKTDSLVNITDNAATLRGIITSSGSGTVTASGFVWDTVPNPTTTVSTKTVNTVLADTFITNITNLQAGKTYYIRAYAINTGGATGYGNQMALTTNVSDSTFTDPRDGQVYTFRHIGTQVWMTKNLNYNASGSACYDDNPANCGLYGRLYDWSTSLTVAPPGWHLPSDTEWQTLIDYL